MEFPSLRECERQHLAHRGIDPETSYTRMTAGIRDGSFELYLEPLPELEGGRAARPWPFWFTDSSRVPSVLPLAAVLSE